MNYLIIGDPSGLHCLNLIERGVSPQDITVWEDTTKGINSCINRGVTVVSDLDELMGQRFSIVIGNPPYGSAGNLAIKFLNKSLELSDDVRFVLPLSIRKPSSTNKIRLDAVCVEDVKLPDDTFPRGIKACVQRWVRTDTPREKIKTFTTHPDFNFVKKEHNPDCMIFRCGASTGKIRLPGEFDNYKPDHYYIQASPQILERFHTISPELIRISRIQNGMPGISKHDLISTYISYFSS